MENKEKVKRETPVINKTTFCEDVKNGLTRGQLREKYQVSDNSLKVICTQFSVEPQRAKRQLFIIQDETPQERVENYNENNTPSVQG